MPNDDVLTKIEKLFNNFAFCFNYVLQMLANLCLFLCFMWRDDEDGMAMKNTGEA